MVNKIDSDVTGERIAVEATIGVLPVEDTATAGPIWYTREPNSYSDFGAKYDSVTRNPINDTRQVGRGTFTNATFSASLEEDVTLTNLPWLMQGVLFADLDQKPDSQAYDSTAIAFTSVVSNTAEDSFNAASGLGSFWANALVKASGFTNSANNGLHVVSTVAAGKLTVGTTLTPEASPPAAARVEVVGHQFASGDLSVTVNGTTYTLVTVTKDLTTLGLSAGEWIYIGGTETANKFATSGTGFARVKSVAAHALVFDRPSFTPLADNGAAKLIHVYLGKHVKNATIATDIVRRSYHVERSLGNDGNGTQSQVIKGCVPNTFEMTVPQTDKMTHSIKFVGTTEELRTGTQGLISASDTVVAALNETAINTSSDIFANRLYVHNAASPLFAYATDVSYSVDNGVKPTTAIGVLGGFDVSVGEFKVTAKATAYFVDITGHTAIAANSDCSLDTIVKVRNHGIVFDVPMLGLGDGTLTVAKNEPIMVALEIMAAKSAESYTFGATFFNYLP